jgi:hypothetical protein
LILGAQAETEPSRATRMIGRLIREEIAVLVGSNAWHAFLQFDPASTATA